MERPKINEIWLSNGYIPFRIIQIINQEKKTWVYYRREKDGEEFYCLEEAFVHRFTRFINE